MEKTYIAIDLKSFYASVECAERGLDPLNANLVVADESRTDKTICLAVSPALKALGISGRARLFEAKQRIREVNAERRRKAPGGRFGRKSVLASELAADASLELGMIVAPPRMRLYMQLSRQIYEIYLRFVGPEDIFAYSVDEVFIDATRYLQAQKSDAHGFAMRMIRQVLQETGITATAGIGPNLYLAKVAMDIVAKHMPADADGVRVAALTERSYREKLWAHEPITDFWRVGPGIARRLKSRGLTTMGDVARCSLGKPGDFHNPDMLYRLLGVNAELLIDHAWGIEPAEIQDIKAYQPENKSLCSGQVLPEPYPAETGCLVVREMADYLAMDLVRKGLVTDQLVLDVGYDIDNLTDPERRRQYKGPLKADYYGRQVPAPAHGSLNFKRATSSSLEMIEAAESIYRRIVDPSLLVRRFYLSVNRLKEEGVEPETPAPEQLSLFRDYEAEARQAEKEAARRSKERRAQETVLAIRDRFGKNAVLRGMNFEEGATARERNAQVGGHHE